MSSIFKAGLHESQTCFAVASSSRESTRESLNRSVFPLLGKQTYKTAHLSLCCSCSSGSLYQKGYENCNCKSILTNTSNVVRLLQGPVKNLEQSGGKIIIMPAIVLRPKLRFMRTEPNVSDMLHICVKQSKGQH